MRYGQGGVEEADGLVARGAPGSVVLADGGSMVFAALMPSVSKMKTCIKHHPG